MKQNHHFLRLVIIALLCLLLTGCGKTEKAGHTAVPASVRAAETSPAQTPESAPEPTPPPTPVPTPEPELRILGKLYNKADTMVELAGLKDADAEGAAAVLRRMPALQLIRIGNETETPLSWESLRLLHDAAPQAVIDYAFTMFERPFNLSDEVMDLKYIQMEDEGALVSKAAACMTSHGPSARQPAEHGRHLAHQLWGLLHRPHGRDTHPRLHARSGG